MQMLVAGVVVKWSGKTAIVRVDYPGANKAIIKADANGRRYPGIGSSVFVAISRIGRAVLV